MSAAGIPGAAVAIVHQGRVAVQGFGLASLSDGTAVTADSLFPLASVTKSFTATAVMQLAEEGALPWTGWLWTTCHGSGWRTLTHGGGSRCVCC